MRKLAMITLVVPDYDEAIRHYRDGLGFALIEDSDLGAGKRWVVVSPGGECRLLLARAANAAQQQRIGDQTGGRVFLFLHTDDFEADHARFAAAGVRFLETPREEAFGRVVVFEDKFGNKWDLIEPRLAA